MVGSPNSLDSLSSPSPSPTPPPSAPKSTNAEHKSGLDSDSELSELTDEDQEAEKQKRKQTSNSRRSRHVNGRGASSSRPSRRGGRRKRGSIVPAPMWGWAKPSEDGDDNDRDQVIGPNGVSTILEGAMDEGGSKTPATFTASPKNLLSTQTSQSHTSPTAESSSSTIQSIVERKLQVDVPISPLDMLTTAAVEVVKSVKAPAGGDETESESEETPAVQPSEEVSAAETDSDAEEVPVSANPAADELEEDGDAAPTKPTPGSPSSIASSRSPTPASSRSPSPTAQREAATVLVAIAKVQDEEDVLEEEEVDDTAIPDAVEETATVPSTSAKNKPKSKSKPHMAIAIPDPEIDLDVEPNPDIDMEVDIEAEVDIDMKEDEVEEEKEDEKEVDDEDKEDDVDEAKEEEEEKEEDEEEEEEIELQPAHRIEALEVLATIELKFALLREKLYVEKMEELAWEESLVSDGTHPELIHLHGELSRRKDKRLELATKKRAFEVANIHKRRKLDEDATWSWWKLARDDLQTEMIAETNRKRRRMERDRRAVERPQPVRRIPQPPTELPISPPTLRKVIKSDPFNVRSRNTKRKDRVSKRDSQSNGLSNHSSTALDRPISSSYPELATLNSSDVRSDLDLLASFRRPAQPPPAQPMFDGHPLGHGHPHRINTPNAMVPPPLPPNMYDHPYGPPPLQMNDNFALFGTPGGRSIASQSNVPAQGFPPHVGPGPSLGQGVRPGSSAGPSTAGPSRPHHVHHHPSPIMSNQTSLGHGAHGPSPFAQPGMGPIEREQEMLSHNRPSSFFNDGGQPQGPPPGYGRRSASPPGSIHAGSSSGRVAVQQGMSFDDRAPVKGNFRDEREREALLNSKDPEIQHALMTSKDPEVRQYMHDRIHAEAEYMNRSNRPSKEELDGYRHFPPNGPYRDSEPTVDREMRQSFGPPERENERLRREELQKYNANHPYRGPPPNHHHHHHHKKPHHHHVVHHHHVQQPSNPNPSSTSPLPANLSPRLSRGEPAENGVYNRSLPPQSHHHPSGPGSAHPTDAINLSSKGLPPSSISWKGDDVQGRDYRDARKINSRPPSGPPSLPGDERERDRHIPVPFSLGSSQPSSAVHSNGPSSTSSPRPAWNTPDHDDNYRSGTHPPPSGSRDVMDSPGHRFASTNQIHPLNRNGSLLPSGSSGPQSPPRSRAYRPSSPSTVPGRSPTRYRERSPPTMNHSKIIRPGSPSITGRPTSATSPSAPSSTMLIGPPPMDVMKNGIKPPSPDVSRSNGGISSTPRLIGSHIEKTALSPSNTSPPKMSVPQIVDSHS